MSIALQKTITLVILILIGVLLKLKIKEKSHINGIKIIILSIALPATIFVALLKIKVEPALLLIPVIALAFNVIMILASKYLLPFAGFEKNSPTSRTLLMMVPSLAPGLSCFPFIMEYLNDESLALAALGDIGNKIFVLIIMYILAMKWFYSNPANQQASENTNNGQKIKSLIIGLFKEPVNMVIISGLILLSIGLNLDTLPAFISQTAIKVSAMMTPLVLIFIGLAVKIKWHQFRMILTLLFWRSGLAFFLSSLLLLVVPTQSWEVILLIVIFPQSAVSFWPFAHMSAVNHMEMEQKNVNNPTFNVDFALTILACSLPFSTLLILAICTIGTPFTVPANVALTGLAFSVLAMLPRLLSYSKKEESVVKEWQHAQQESN